MRAKTINELLSFERGRGTRQALGIGIWGRVTSKILRAIGEYDQMGEDKQNLLGKWVDMYNYKKEDIDLIKKAIKQIYSETPQPLIFGQSYYAEIDDKKAIRKIKAMNKRGYSFVYNWSPEWKDGYSLAFSKVELPAAEKIKVVMGKDGDQRILMESLEFQRTGDTKRSLKLGRERLIPKITSSDLERFSYIWDEIDEDLSEQEIKEEMIDIYKEEWDPNDQEIDIMFLILDLYKKKKFIYGDSFDWKEEEQMMDYLGKKSKKEFKNYPYVYNGSPGSDQWWVVWSKIEFPEADTLED